MKTASKASIREQWQRTQPDEFISDRKGKRRGAQGGRRVGRSGSEGLVGEQTLGIQSQRQKGRNNVNRASGCQG